MFSNTTQRLLGLALCSVLLLGACAEALIGGAVMSGVLAATDRRNAGALIDDPTIQLKAEARIHAQLGSNVHVNVVSFNRTVLITGEANSAKAKEDITRVVGSVENVFTILNEVQVMPASSLGTRANDAIITTKVKASFVDAKDIYATAFKVVTERGVVYLLGRVTPTEGQRAASVAGGVQEVVKVVKIFEYIGTAELNRLQTTPTQSPVSEQNNFQ